MKPYKNLTKLSIAGVLLSCTLPAMAEHVDVQRTDVHVSGAEHTRNYSEHLNNYGQKSFNNGQLAHGYNHDNLTVNNYRGGHYGANYNRYNGNYNYPYRGWNQGPIGWNNGWNSGWSNGNNNGGWGAGLLEGLIGGIAATSLFNYFFNHSSSQPTAVYAGSGGSYPNTSGGDLSNQQPPQDISTNNTTNTVIEDNGMNPGYWLLGVGLLILAGLGNMLYLRKPSQAPQGRSPNRQNLRREPHPSREPANNYAAGNERYPQERYSADERYLEDNRKDKLNRNECFDNRVPPSRSRRRLNKC